MLFDYAIDETAIKLTVYRPIWARVRVVWARVRVETSSVYYFLFTFTFYCYFCCSIYYFTFYFYFCCSFITLLFTFTIKRQSKVKTRSKSKKKKKTNRPDNFTADGPVMDDESIIISM